MSEWRVTASPNSFDLEELEGHNRKTGEPVWRKVAYYRKRSELVAGLKRHNAPTELADALPKYHPDSEATVRAFLQTQMSNNSEARREALRKARARSREAKALESAVDEEVNVLVTNGNVIT